MFAEAAAALDRRLDPAAREPIAVAVSGGADSLCALLAVSAWARRAGRPVIALSVDHGLQPGSDGWTAFAGERATRLGAAFRPLRWDGAKPRTGLPAAARAARHRLLADAAREAGALVIVTGHTADDAGENAVLGQGRLHEWSPSPVWPEGRDLFLLRPLLGLGRAAIRERLAAAGECWIDDPANADLSHPRIRARLQGTDPAPASPDSAAADLAREVHHLWGGFRIDRALLRGAPPEAARRVIAAAVTCAGGGETPPRAERVAALLGRLLEPEPFIATLAGAKVVADQQIVIARNAGEAARGGLAPVPLSATCVWDGRYELEGRDPGVTVVALAARARTLPPWERAALTRVPAVFRPGLPLLIDPSGDATCPNLAQEPSPVRFRPLAASRFAASCGAIAQERDAKSARHGATPSPILCCLAVCNTAC